MTVRTLVIPLVLLGASLAMAGCLRGDSAADAPDATNETDFNKLNPEGRSLLAFEETNKTEQGAGGVDHHHDMWNGATRMEMFSTEAAMRPMNVLGTASYQATATFRPPDGKFVWEGTATIEFTISEPRRHACEGQFVLNGHFVCTDTLDEYGLVEIPSPDDPNGGPDGLELRYKHASTTQWIDVGPIAWGTPAIIKITDPTQTDMPHATASAWEFQIVSPHKEDSTLVFTAKAEIVRGEGEIPLWPGHPDFYADSCCRRVLDAPEVAACDGTACALVPDAEEIVADKLVSYGTRTLHVWVNITDVFAPNPALAPDVWFLWHTNSTGRANITNIFDKDGHGADQKEHYWILPVDDNGMDSPYADGSKWRFALGGAFFKEGISCYGGCADWNAKYSIVVMATNEELPGDAYHMACLDPDECPDDE